MIFEQYFTIINDYRKYIVYTIQIRPSLVLPVCGSVPQEIEISHSEIFLLSFIKFI